MLTGKDFRERANLHKSKEGLKKLADLHWKEHRPNLYRELQESGELEDSLESAAVATWNAMQRLQERLMKENGLTLNEAKETAWELMREEYILLPSEEDMPLLGEKPKQDVNQNFLDLMSMENPPRSMEE